MENNDLMVAMKSILGKLEELESVEGEEKEILNKELLEKVLDYLGIPSKRVSAFVLFPGENTLSNYQFRDKFNYLIDKGWTEGNIFDNDIIIYADKENMEFILSNEQFYTDILIEVNDNYELGSLQKAEKLFYSYFTEDSNYM